MCGIFGYAGKSNAAQAIIKGLRRLEYRGYDSWGVAVITEEGEGRKINVVKEVGGIEDLSKVDVLGGSSIGIGHTRWATHGGVTQNNAHPHYSTDNSFVLAQNGIVENYQELKADLKTKGYEFTTQTDTEVIVHLVEEARKAGLNLKDSLMRAFSQLKGRNTIIMLSAVDDYILAVRNGSPLVVGISGEDFYFASDTLSFSDQTNKVVFVENFQMVEYNYGELTMYDVVSGDKIDYEVKEVEHGDINIDKEGYDYYMLKEIFEQKFTLNEATSYTEQEFAGLVEAIKQAENVFTIGAGGAFFAADQIAYFLRTIAGVKALGLKAYEVESFIPNIKDNDLLIVISQSGETADNLEAIELIEKSGKKVRIASAVNMIGSTTSRISKFSFLSRSGPELCVISTKSGTAQTAFGYLLAKSLVGEHNQARTSIKEATDSLEEYLQDSMLGSIERVAKELKDKEHLFVLGKGANFQVATIAALNIKEASYLHAEAFTAGELKHGVIALIDQGTPVLCIVDNDEHRDYMLGAAAEVKARGAHVIGLARENNELFDSFIELPSSDNDASAIINVVPSQLLAYYVSVLRGHNPDKPRNLAKSVTVK